LPPCLFSTNRGGGKVASPTECLNEEKERKMHDSGIQVKTKKGKVHHSGREEALLKNLHCALHFNSRTPPRKAAPCLIFFR